MTEQSPTPEDPTADAAPGGSEADQPAPVTEAAAVPPPPPHEPPTAVTPPPPPAPTTPPSAGPTPGEPVAPPPPPPPFPPPPAGPAVEFGPDGGASSATAGERPEIPIAAAFAGGFVLAMILKRLAK